MFDYFVSLRCVPFTFILKKTRFKQIHLCDWYLFDCRSREHGISMMQWELNRQPYASNSMIVPTESRSISISHIQFHPYGIAFAPHPYPVVFVLNMKRFIYANAHAYALIISIHGKYSGIVMLINFELNVEMRNIKPRFKSHNSNRMDSHFLVERNTTNKQKLFRISWRQFFLNPDTFPVLGAFHLQERSPSIASVIHSNGIFRSSLMRISSVCGFVRYWLRRRRRRREIIRKSLFSSALKEKPWHLQHSHTKSQAPNRVSESIRLLSRSALMAIIIYDCTKNNKAIYTSRKLQVYQ